MNVTIDANQGKNAISSYDVGYFVINEHKIDANIIVSDNQLSTWPDEIDPFDPAALIKALKAMQTEIVIFGTGKRSKQLPPDIMRKLMVQEIGFEVMDTGAACRTYNLLLGDSRRVTAVLETLQA